MKKNTTGILTTALLVTVVLQLYLQLNLLLVRIKTLLLPLILTHMKIME